MATQKKTAKQRRLDTELLERMPPYSEEAEMAVLGSVLIEPNRLDDVASWLDADDFYDVSHRTIYLELRTMFDDGRKVDRQLFFQHLRDVGRMEEIGGAAYLSKLLRFNPTTAHIEHYARIVRDKATLRHLIHVGTEAVRSAFDSEDEPDVALATAESAMLAIGDRRNLGGKQRTITEVLHDVMDQIDKRREHKTADGLSTGYPELNALTGGMRPGELIILAARPSCGKTALGVNIAEHVALREKQPVLFVSLEMGAAQIAERLLCGVTRIPAYRLRNGMLSKSQSKELVEASCTLSSSPILIEDSPSMNMSQIASVARRANRRERLGLIVVDYLQLIDPDRHRDPRQEQVAKISRRLKHLSRDVAVPVLCLAQLNRQADAEGQLPRLSHLRESGAIEQDADVVMFIHKADPLSKQQGDDSNGQDSNAGDPAKLIIAKQRSGPCGKVPLVWFGKIMRFETPSDKPVESYDWTIERSRKDVF